MHVDDIPPAEWGDFCRSFTHQHQGWIADLARVDERGHAEPVVEDGRLRSLEPGEPADGGGLSELQLTVEPRTVAVNGPRRIRFAETDEGGHSSLWIDAADGSSLVLRFRVPARPETVDGVAD